MAKAHRPPRMFEVRYLANGPPLAMRPKETKSGLSTRFERTALMLRTFRELKARSTAIGELKRGSADNRRR